VSANNPFGQVLVALVTPMLPDGEVDWAAVEKHIDDVISNGADGIVVTGTTGETSTLTDAEKLRLVDLPGYGFARVSRTAKDRFQNLGRQYLRGRPNLKRVYLLIDARHGLKEPDAEALDALDTAAVSYQIVLTKADKIKAWAVYPAGTEIRTIDTTTRPVSSGGSARAPRSASRSSPATARASAPRTGHVAGGARRS